MVAVTAAIDAEDADQFVCMCLSLHVLYSKHFTQIHRIKYILLRRSPKNYKQINDQKKLE